MNYKLVLKTLGRIFLISGLVVLVPIIVTAIYGENTYWSFLIPSICFLVLGAPLSFLRPTEKKIYAKEGLFIVALSWITLSLLGALPYIISGTLTNYADAFFEAVSGFTTTGSSVIANVEGLEKSIMFWRSFTNFIGGMGVLVFFLAIIPADSQGSIYIFKAESPGPTASKFVSKMRSTALILYAIYLGLTAILTVMLVCGGVSFFESLLQAFATAATGGFSTRNNSIAGFNSVYVEMVIAVFMLLYGVNFNVFYLILIGKFKKAFASEELRVYSLILFGAVVAIVVDLIIAGAQFGEALRLSFFQVTSISSTTGFSTANFDGWPSFSKGILLFLMIIGACGGSTGGGLKVSRLIILCKSGYADMKRITSPRSVVKMKFEGEPLEEETMRSVRTYFILWVILFVLGTLIIGTDSFGDIFTDISASLTCIGNVGPGFNLVGPMLNFAGYNAFSKVILAILMLIGRLEIFPIILLFSVKTWKRT